MTVLRWMRTAAHWRHAMLCAVLYGHDRYQMQREMLFHRDLVDFIYSPWVAARQGV